MSDNRATVWDLGRHRGGEGLTSMPGWIVIAMVLPLLILVGVLGWALVSRRRERRVWEGDDS
jgi:hypothetical protein